MDNRMFSNKMIGFFTKVKKMHIVESQNQEINHHQSMMLLKIYMAFSKETVRVSSIAKILELAPSTVSLLLNGLEQNGYIKRNINQENRREVDVSITEKGIKKACAVQEKIIRKMDYIQEQLGEKDAAKLITLLEKVIVILEKEEGK